MNKSIRSTVLCDFLSDINLVEVHIDVGGCLEDFISDNFDISYRKIKN